MRTCRVRGLLDLVQLFLIALIMLLSLIGQSVDTRHRNMARVPSRGAMVHLSGVILKSRPIQSGDKRA